MAIWQRLAAMEGADKAGAATDQQQAAHIQIALEQVAHGDLASARQILVEAFGPEAVEAPGLRAPLARQAIVTVKTEATLRTLRLTLADYREPAAVTGLLDQAAESLRGLPEIQISTGPDWLALALPYQSMVELNDLQARAATALSGSAAELALLIVTLKTDQSSLLDEETTFQITSRYTERVDLKQPGIAWEQMARQLEGTAPHALAGIDEAGQAQLAQVQHALWTADAADWRTLADQSRAEYSVELGAKGPARQWLVPAGTDRTMVAEVSSWRYDRLLMSAARVIFVVLLVSFVIWRLA